MFGIINLYKPVGLSSRQALDRVADAIEPIKAGHAGTLDPIASGVLLVCVGQATRVIDYVQKLPKYYRATFQLGCTSASDDTEKPVTQIADAPIPSLAEIERALPRFVGTIMQTPPAFSAVKVSGRRSYKIARKGRVPNLTERPVRIDALRVIDYSYPRLELDVECGSGTYVRSLGRDLAKELGTGAVMSALERTAIGPFTSDDAIEPDGIWREVILQKLQPVQRALPNWPRVTLSDIEIRNLVLGRGVSQERKQQLEKSESYSITDYWLGEYESGRLAAIFQKESNGDIATESVFRPDSMP